MIEDYRQELEGLKRLGRLRGFRPLTGRTGCRVHYQGREMLNLTSNDYLGLAGDETLHRRFYKEVNTKEVLEKFGLGVASSRLLAGDSILAHELEQALGDYYGKEDCLLFNSGYHANIGILPALLGKKDLILSDKLNHASLTDGMRLSGAEYKRFRHLDYDHLRYLLETYRHRCRRAIIVSESVFSMDGDVCDLNELVSLKKEYNCLLYLDEAHSVGLYGQKGCGVGEQQQHLDDVDLLVGTFGKAFGAIGAFVLCPRILRDFLVNKSRSLIFTTALPPVILHWNLFILRELTGFEDKRQKLEKLAIRLRQALIAQGLQTWGSTNIVPVLLGDDRLAVGLAEKMQQQGFLIFPVRPPAVPENTARFRLSLTADMEWEDLEPLPGLIAEISRRAG